MQGSKGHTDTVHRLVDTVGEGEGGQMERAAQKHAHYIRRVNGQGDFTVSCRAQTQCTVTT